MLKEKVRLRKKEKRAELSKSNKTARTPAERKRLSRAAQSTEKRDEEKEKDCIRKEELER